MILIIAVLAIALLAMSALAFVLNRSLKRTKAIADCNAQACLEEITYRKKIEAEVIVLRDECSAGRKAEARHAEMEAELKKYKSAFKELVTEDDPQERGNHFRHRVRRKTTAETYRIVFDMDQHGQRVLEDLVNRFKRSPFTPDDQGGERETSRRIGHAEVVDFLINKVNVANSPNYNEALEIAYMEQNDE